MRPIYTIITCIREFNLLGKEDNFNLKVVTASRDESESKVLKKKISNDSYKKIGRNEPCSCGSGKKYKHCCGRL